MDDQNQNQLIIVSAVIVDGGGRVLLLKRDDSQKRAPNKYELPSGKVEFGEEPLNALERIVKAQTGLKVVAGKLLTSSSHVSETDGRHIIIFYNMAELLDSDTASSATPDETHVEATWTEVNKLDSADLEKNLQNALPRILSHLENSQAINRIVAGNTTTAKLFVNTDGGSRGNPGPSASGFVILNDKQEVLEEGGEYLGVTTNNQAEYQAVKLGLNAAKKYHAEKVVVRIDSLLVVNQMKGLFKIKSKDLWPIHEAIKKLSEEFKDVEFTHVPREQNVLADAKVNEVLDSRKELTK